MINKGMYLTGGIMFIIGLGGLGGACEGHGSFLVSAIVTAIGFGLSWLTYTEVD